MPDVRVRLQRSRQKVASTWNHGCSHKVTNPANWHMRWKMCLEKSLFRPRPTTQQWPWKTHNRCWRWAVMVGEMVAISIFRYCCVSHVSNCYTFCLLCFCKRGSAILETKSWSELVVLICYTTSSFSTKAASCKLSPWTVNTDVDEHDWCSCALRRGCALCLPAAVVGWRQSSHKVRTNWSSGGASPSTNPHISVTWWLADLGIRLTVIFRAFRNILMITSKLTKRIKERSIREGLLKKNCCSFGFCPNYQPRWAP